MNIFNKIVILDPTGVVRKKARVVATSSYGFTFEILALESDETPMPKCEVKPGDHVFYSSSVHLSFVIPKEQE